MHRYSLLFYKLHHESVADNTYLAIAKSSENNHVRKENTK